MEEIKNGKIFKWNINDIKDIKYIKPKLNYIWEAEQNPNYELVMKTHKEWLMNLNLLKSKEECEKYYQLKCPMMTSYLNPFNPTENFIWINRLNELIYIIDDIYMENGKKGKDWVDNVVFNRESNERVSLLFWDIMDNIRKTGNSEATDQLIKITHEWFYSVLELNESDLNSKTTTDEYIAKRAIEVGMVFSIFNAKVYVEPVPLEIENHPLYIEIFKNYNIAHLMINDINSFNKEIKSPRMGNLIKILSYQFNSIQKAMDQAKDIANQAISTLNEKCIQLKQLFPNDYKDQLDYHINLIQKVIAGNAFCSENPLYPRYNGIIYEEEFDRPTSTKISE